MSKKKKTAQPEELPRPGVEPEITPGHTPESPSIPAEEPPAIPMPQEPAPNEIPPVE